MTEPDYPKTHAEKLTEAWDQLKADIRETPVGRAFYRLLDWLERALP